MRNSVFKTAVIFFCLLFMPVITVLANTEDNGKEVIALDIMKSIELALGNDLLLKEAGKDVEIAEAKLRQIKSGLYPAFSAQTRFSRYNSTPSIELPGGFTKSLIDENQRDVTFTLQYLIYDGGGVYSLKSQGEANLEAYRINEEKVRQDVIYRTSMAYLNSLRTEQLLLVAREYVELSKEQLDLAQKRFDAGTVPKADVLKAEASLADGETKLIEAENLYNISLKALNDATGLPLDTEVSLSGDYKYREWNISLEESRKMAEDNRLESDIVRKTRESAYYAIEFAKSSWYPDLFFKLDYTAYGNSLVVDTGSVVATVGAQFNIFDGFRTGGEVDEAEAKYEKLSLELDNVEKKINLDVTTAHMNFQAASEKVFKADESVAAASESYRVAQISYREGISPFIDVSQAQVILLQAEVSQVQAIYSYYVSKVELLRAMGLLEEIGKDDWN